MSSTATKPSPALTWSPSATSLQKRQSGRDAMDAFRRDARGTRNNDRSHWCVDEPGRIVVAVSAAGPVDEHDVIGPNLGQPTFAALPFRERAQAGTALPLDRRWNRVFRRGDGAGAGRVGKDVDFRDPSGLDRSHCGCERRVVLG